MAAGSGNNSLNRLVLRSASSCRQLRIIGEEPEKAEAGADCAGRYWKTPCAEALGDEEREPNVK